MDVLTMCGEAHLLALVFPSPAPPTPSDRMHHFAFGNNCQFAFDAPFLPPSLVSAAVVDTPPLSIAGG
ncbi:unnamed protein product [Heligmosomoides polygyrus]|uniref:Secreted protein n=1 Tax=Heligmosomoides polygyrus TaxID=6339 RepID=A0A183FZX9_HELPZ|nr:unnamed protein product [Heligmosomoides polygyrus]